MKKILSICCLFIALIATSQAQTKHLDPTADPVAKAKGLQKQLKLNDEQTTKIAGIYKESSEKFAKIKAEEHGNTNKMVVRITPLRTATIKKIKEVLTPKQSVKYDALLKDKSAVTGNGWGDGWSAADAN